MLTNDALRRQALESLRRGELRPPKKQADACIQPACCEEVPLSCGQQQVWLHSEFAPGAPIYNESITVRKTGRLDPAVLESCFNEIVRRHAVWRTAFLNSSGKVLQTVLPRMHVPLPLIDLSYLSPCDALSEAIRLAREDASRPFDLSQPPLLRARLIRLAEEDHRLYLTFDHLVFDGVSIYRVFLPELAALYRAFSAGQASPLPELPIQYGDYAVWQQRKLANGDFASQINYWRKALAIDAPVLQLPIVKPRTALPAWQGGMEIFAIPAGLSQAIREFSAREGATVYMTLLAAFHALLYRYSAQEQIATGAVVSTRNRPELEPLIGFLLNTIVLQSRAQSALSFRAFLNQIKDRVLGALANSDVPFDTVVRELAPKRDSNRNTLFQILFSLRPASGDFPDGWDLSELDVHSGASGFDLFVDVIEHPATLSGRFIYRSGLFEPSAIARMIGHWQTLLGAAAGDPDLPLGALPLLAAGERQALLDSGAGPAAQVPDVTISRLFEQQAKQVPGRIAVIFEDQALTFQDLEHRAADFARKLSSAGAKPGMLVAVSLERSVEMLVALLGILKIGAGYLPLDPKLPAERRGFLLSDAKPHFCVSSTALALTDLRRASSGHYAGLAYVLYTSGSTGVPKGVEVPESAVVNFLRSLQREPGFSSTDILLAVTTLSFDIAVLELFLPLISGGAVVIAPRKTVNDPVLLMDVIRHSKCTVMQGTPAIWRSLIDAGWAGNPQLKVLCGGESLSRALADNLLPRCRELWNMYGPTETTIWSTVEKVGPRDGPVPIGRPIDNTHVYVLDPQLQPVPPGVTGELYIGGSGLARGYAGKPELTAERFLPSPFASGRRLYRTGDLARWRSGDLELLGRADNQVKVRGYRIELQEIEDALAKTPGVRGAAVKTWRDASGENGLAAYIEGTALAADVRQYLSRKLPDYMIPSRFVHVQALPLTHNGKLNRKALPDPAQEQPGTTEGTAPRNDTEQRLATLWSSVLGTPVPGIHDDFFSLGGHSLLAAELSRRIHAEFGRILGLSTIFEAPTVAALARLIDSKDNMDSLSDLFEPEDSSEQRYLYWMYGGASFLPLASHLRPACRFHPIWLPPEVEETIRASDRLEDVARLMVAEMRTQRHNGPYQLGGWCISGILAYEVAVQLEAAGEAVNFVALLGAPNPQHYTAIPASARLKSKLHYHWKKITRLDLAGVSRYVMERARYHAGAQNPSRTREFSRVLLQLALKYQPKPLHARVALFQGEDRPSIVDYAAGWTGVVKGEFAAYDVPGDHETSLAAPNVAVLARKLRDCLH